MPAQLPFDLPHEPSLARDDLIVSASNRLAVAAIESWPRWQHPVLLVVGPAGAGKTHLASAWCDLSGARLFAADDVLAAAPSQPFALALDDVDRTHDETALFRLVNAARLGGGTILATATSLPAAMDLRLPDLKSRLQAATIVELGAPDEDLLAAVLAKLFADRQIAVDPRWLGYLSVRMERSLDMARRFVAAVDREALAGKGRISRGLLQKTLLDMSGDAGAGRHQTVAASLYGRDDGECE